MITRNPNSRSEIVGLLDIGSSKICCLIVERAWPQGSNSAPALRVLGVGHQRSQGVKAGTVIDMEQAEASVRAAVGQAERMADVTLEDVVATVSCGRMKSVHFSAHVDLEAGFVRQEDITKLASAARTFTSRDGRIPVHVNQVSFLLDGQPGVRTPLRLAGRRLTANFHAVTADPDPVENLLMLIDRCYLGVRQLVPSSLASALSATTSEERRLGVTSISIGAGVIDIASFSDEQFIFSDTMPFGGAHLTYDIARLLTTPLAEAERIKTLYGTLVAARSDEHEVVSYRLAGEFEGEAYQTTKAELRRILYPRIESQLSLVRDRLARSEVAGRLGGTVVLSGGGSRMIGFADVAARQLGRPVRLASPPVVDGLPGSMAGFECGAAAGLGLVAPARTVELKSAVPAGGASRSYFDRMERWLRESF